MLSGNVLSALHMSSHLFILQSYKVGNIIFLSIFFEMSKQNQEG
jgi:hypothetical protein